MRESKLTFNGVLITVIIFAAIAFFITVTMTRMSDRTAINSYNQIEGTDYAVRYSNLEPDGLYKGDESNSILLTEGTFGYDWGAVVAGDFLYINEYKTTDLAVVVSQLVRINLNNGEKKVLYDNTVLRGKCASGELVALSNYLLPANKPGTNRFCKLYNLTVNADTENGADVIYIDSETDETVFTTKQTKGLKESFEDMYLNRTLEEVMK